MDMHAKHHVTLEILPRYLAADKEAKGRILDEYCAITGYGRKYAIAKLRTYQLERNVQEKKPGKHTRQRVRIYDMAVEEAVGTIWRAYDAICAERLHPKLGDKMEKLISCKELAVDPVTDAKVRRMSCATLKRMLKRIRIRATNRVSGTTKPGTLLKSEIPLRVGNWNETEPGFLEVDTVAHCGDCAAGEFAHTLSTVDIATTWFEAEAVLGKAQARVLGGIERIRERLPCPLQGLDSDSGYEFVNWELYRYCKNTGVVFTRSRPYKKNDNAHIEQKNWTCVRKILGYMRIETQEHADCMNELYRGPLRDYINFFLPSMQCTEKRRVGSRIVKKYDEAKTPYERVLASPHIQDETKVKLRRRFDELNPVALKRGIAMLKTRIFSGAPRHGSRFDS